MQIVTEYVEDYEAGIRSGKPQSEAVKQLNGEEFICVFKDRIKAEGVKPLAKRKAELERRYQEYTESFQPRIGGLTQDEFMK